MPEGTQSGQIFRKKAKGLPNPQGGRGDLYVSIQVVIPPKISRDQRRLLEELREMLPAENEPEEKSILDKVKDYFM